MGDLRKLRLAVYRPFLNCGSFLKLALENIHFYKKSMAQCLYITPLRFFLNLSA